MAEHHMKTLAKETAIYGISSVLGKFLNWLLVPMYTYVLASSADYGKVTNLYSWTALLVVILTYGMETGYFRFANKYRDNADRIYASTLISVGTTSLFFAMICLLAASPIASVLGYEKNPEYIQLLGVVVAMDAFASIPFAYLRFVGHPVKFAILKFLYIALNISFNIFFLVVCPWLMKVAPSSIDWFYNPQYGVGYVFVSNILSTLIQTLALLPSVFVVRFEFDRHLLLKILRYSFPLLIVGVAAVMNQTLDKILFPYLMPGLRGQTELGIYGATSKIAMVMLVFTQAFRYAYEPFIFARYKDINSKEAYAEAMKFFVIFSLMILLGMVLFQDVFKYIIDKSYWVGLELVPVILVSFIFQGIFFNLSLWYKLTDKTSYGAWFSVLGTIIMVVGNIVLVPLWSYSGSAWSSLVGYFVIMLLSYVYGQKHFPIRFDFKIIGFYTVLTVLLILISQLVYFHSELQNMVFRTGLMAVFMGLMLRRILSLRASTNVNQ